MKVKRALAALVLVLSVVASGQVDARVERPGRPGPVQDTDAVLRWNAIAAEAMLASGITPLFDPLHESRLYAMVHIAVHDALNAIERRSEPYALDIGHWPEASADAAVAAAAHGVLLPALEDLPVDFQPGVPAAVAVADGAYAEALAGMPDDATRRLGLAIGRAAAAVTVALRADDGSHAPYLDPAYPEGDAPGEFRFVEGLPFAAAPGWAEVTPFAMRDQAQFRPPPPHKVRSRAYAADLNEIKELGRSGESARTPDQTQAALFWFESSPLRWNRIARTAADQAGLDMWADARLFGLLNVALADGYIGNWESKHEYDHWRPETAIRLADEDGNRATTAEAGWLPLWGSSGATPEHDSGHAIEGAAAAEVLRRVLGTDAMELSVCSYTLQPGTAGGPGTCDQDTPVLRSYTSFTQAAEENATSRIWLGWHFRKAVEDGMVHGQAIGGWAVDTLLRPVDPKGHRG